MVRDKAGRQKGGVTKGGRRRPRNGQGRWQRQTRLGKEKKDDDDNGKGWRGGGWVVAAGSSGRQQHEYTGESWSGDLGKKTREKNKTGEASDLRENTGLIFSLRFSLG